MKYRLGLLGKQLSHSFSAGYFRQKGLGQDVAISYTLHEVNTPGALEAWLRGPATQLQGFNVTMPYKTALIPLLSELTPTARAVGAVNTVVRLPTGGWLGHNTDAEGFAAALAQWGFSPPPGSVALVLGAGGAARAALHVLGGQLQVSMTVVSRAGTPPAIAHGAQTPHTTFGGLAAEAAAQARLLVNCTPLGMHPHVSGFPPIPYEALGPGHWVFDMVYNPPETEFLRRARRQGAQTRNGLAMLHAQAEAAWEFWRRHLG